MISMAAHRANMVYFREKAAKLAVESRQAEMDLINYAKGVGHGLQEQGQKTAEEVNECVAHSEKVW